MSDYLELAVWLVVVVFGLITWWVWIAWIVPNKRKQQRAAFLGYIEHHHGVMEPVPTMDGFTFFDFGSPKYHAQSQAVAAANPIVGAQHLSADYQGRLQIAGRQVIVAVGTAAVNDERSIPVLFWQVELQGSITGWARIRSVRSRFRGLLPHVSTESVEVNRHVHVHAYPRQLAFTLFAPDVLAWYLDKSQQPWVFVSGNRLILVIEAQPDLEILTAMEEDVGYFVRAIERSGALEQKP